VVDRGIASRRVGGGEAAPKTPRPPGRRRWRNRNVWACAGSAFLADLGYQAVLAGLPLFLVVRLHGTTSEYALASGLAYGVGALAGWLGGRLGDRLGHRRVALVGNLGVLLLGLVGLARTPAVVVALFVLGWWSRNFRSPPRRALLAASVGPEDQGRAFGFLHALDVGGGMLAALGTLGLLSAGIGFGRIFLLALGPIALSSAALALATDPPAPAASPTSPAAGTGEMTGARRPAPGAAEVRPSGGTSTRPERPRAAVRGVLAATALYGFSTYSLGFPVLTVAAAGRSLRQGVGAYAVLLGVSALAGWLLGGRRWKVLPTLALGGYGLSAAGTLALGLLAAAHESAPALDAAVAVVGAALGVVEVAEPRLVAGVSAERARGRALGALSGARSVGLLAANLAMGLLYGRGPLAAYAYAGSVALLALVVLLAAGARARLSLRLAA